MVGNLSVHHQNSVLRHADINDAGNTRVNHRLDNQTQKSKQHSKSTDHSTARAKTDQFELNQELLEQSKQSFDKVKHSLDRRTVLFRMMETMGGTGTNTSQTGIFLDTYI